MPIDANDFKAMDEEAEEHFKEFEIHWADYILVGLFVSLFAVVFLQFFTRYVLNDSLPWTEEVARYNLIVLAFAGAVRCQAIGAHICLEFVDPYYKSFLPIIRIIAELATLLLFVVLIWSLFGLIQRTSFQTMVSLPFPKYYLYALVAAALGLNIILIIFQVARRLKHVTKG